MPGGSGVQAVSGFHEIGHVPGAAAGELNGHRGTLQLQPLGRGRLIYAVRGEHDLDVEGDGLLDVLCFGLRLDEFTGVEFTSVIGLGFPMNGSFWLFIAADIDDR